MTSSIILYLYHSLQTCIKMGLFVNKNYNNSPSLSDTIKYFIERLVIFYKQNTNQHKTSTRWIGSYYALVIARFICQVFMHIVTIYNRCRFQAFYLYLQKMTHLFLNVIFDRHCNRYCIYQINDLILQCQSVKQVISYFKFDVAILFI